MEKYYVNTRTDSNDNHEVHKQSCSYFPAPENRKYLGEFSNCAGAVAAARQLYSNSDGCYYCSRECHMG